jgi:hypothetical protein
MTSGGGGKERFGIYCRSGDRGFMIGGRGEKGVAEMKRERRLEKAHWRSSRRLSKAALFQCLTNWFICGWILGYEYNETISSSAPKNSPPALFFI